MNNDGPYANVNDAGSPSINQRVVTNEDDEDSNSIDNDIENGDNLSDVSMENEPEDMKVSEDEQDDDELMKTSQQSEQEESDIDQEMETTNTITTVDFIETDPAVMAKFGTEECPHPLLFHNIVRDILRSLTIPDQIKCRSICHVWNEESCRLLQKQITVTFVDNSNITNYMKHYNRTPPSSSSSAAASSAALNLSNLHRLEHTTYQFYKIEFAESNKTLLEFLQKHGHHIHKLILQQSQPIQEKELYWALQNYLPNLESLWLRNIPFTPKISKFKEKMAQQQQASSTALPSTSSLGSAGAPRCSTSAAAIAAQQRQEPRENIFPTIKHLTVGTQSFILRERGILREVEVAAAGGGLMGVGDGQGQGGQAQGQGLPPGDGQDGDLQQHMDHHPNFPPLQHQPAPRRVIHVPVGAVDELAVQNALLRLLSTLPNLQSFTCSTLDGPCDRTVSTNILKALIRMPPTPIGFLHLTELNFPLHLTQTLTIGFNHLQLCNLTELSITLDKDIEIPTTKDLFNISTVRNLRKLVLILPQDFPFGKCIRLPSYEMRRLKELVLHRYRWSLDFLGNLIGLETLCCVDMTLGPIFPIHFPHHGHGFGGHSQGQQHELGLKTLKLQGADYPMNDAEVMCRITRAFPRLQVLHCFGINDETLRVIYTYLPFLTELQCMDGQFTDCGISGVSLEVCNDLAETLTYLIVNPDKFRRDLFIGNLTNLKYLRLESQQMTHLSVLFGIVKCTRVEHLCLKSDNVADAAVESIADQMLGTLKTLNLINCPSVTEAGKFFARERVPNLKVYINGDAVEVDPAQAADNKAHILHSQFDEFSRRRGRERPGDRPGPGGGFGGGGPGAEGFRRRLAIRIAQMELMNDRLLGAGGAQIAAGIVAGAVAEGVLGEGEIEISADVGGPPPVVQDDEEEAEVEYDELLADPRRYNEQWMFEMDRDLDEPNPRRGEELALYIAHLERHNFETSDDDDEDED